MRLFLGAGFAAILEAIWKPPPGRPAEWALTGMTR